MKLILLILTFVAVVTGFATTPINATVPDRMTYRGPGAAFAYWDTGGGFAGGAAGGV